MEKKPYIRFNFDEINAGRALSTKQIINLIKKQIYQDKNLRGCRLPPVRALSHQLGLSKNTIQTAYDELKSQGLIISKDRLGIFVCEDEKTQPIGQQLSVPLPRLNTFSLVKNIRSKSSKIIYLSSVFVDPRILPKDKLTSCFKSVLKSPGLPEFSDPQGMKALREMISKRLKNRGIAAESDHIIVTNGSQQALDLVTRALQIKIVATEEPSYQMGRRLFDLNQVQTVGLPINPFRGIEEALWEDRLRSEKPSLAYLTTNFQNPSGYSYSSFEISKILKWANQYDFGILEDDWGADMLSYSEFKPGLRSLGGENVLYMNSFTKKLLPSLRIGFLVANDKTVEPLLNAKKVSTSANAGIIEATLFEFLDRGYYDTHLKYIQKELDIRYRHCLQLLRETMPIEVRWNAPGGGPVLWLEVPRNINLNIVAKKLVEKGVIIQIPEGVQLSHGLKIGYAFLAKEEMEEGISKLSSEIKEALS